MKRSLQMMNSHKKYSKISFDDLIVKNLDHYTIVNKPPFISSLEDKNDRTHLLDLARKTDPNYQLCHRLDKETSGVIVLAKTPEAYRNFAMQLEKREVKKVYHAVIHGRHQFHDFEAIEPLVTTSNRSRVDFKLGKPSLTLISTIEIFKKSTLIKCFPLTGRMHQIRVHLSYHEAPLVGDSAYGGQDLFLADHKRNFNIGKYEERRPMIHRVALHANNLAFKDLKGDVVEVEAPYPKDFSVLVKQLKKYN